MSGKSTMTVELRRLTTGWVAEAVRGGLAFACSEVRHTRQAAVEDLRQQMLGTRARAVAAVREVDRWLAGSRR